MDDPDAPPPRNFAGSDGGKGVNGNKQRYRKKRGVEIGFEEGGAGSGSAVGRASSEYGAVAMDVVDVDAAAAAVAAARNSSGGGQAEEEDKEKLPRDSRRAKKPKTRTENGGVMASQLESIVHTTSESSPYIARRWFYCEQLHNAAR
jgi:hypothetical protein